MKKFRTKRGFTMVEIMVAFVIFAIMAGMISTLLMTINKTKQENLDIERQIDTQRSNYYLSELDTKYDSGTDTLSFGFDGYSNISVKYDVENENASGYKGLTIQYPVGDVDYSKLSDGTYNDEENDKKGGSGVTDRMDSRIYGDETIDYIGVKLEKDTSYSGPGYRYLVYSTSKSSTYGNSLDNEYCYYSQYRLVFPSPILDYGYYVENGDGTITEKTREEPERETKNGVSITYDVFCPGNKINVLYDLVKDETGNPTKRGSVLLHGGVIRVASLVSGSAATISQLHEAEVETRFFVVLEDELVTAAGAPEYKRWDINDITTIFGTYGDTNGDGSMNKDDVKKMSDIDSEYKSGGDKEDFGDYYAYYHYNDGTTIHNNVFGGFPTKDYNPST